jgi:4-hydroxy-tetrahydrodipicolinate synthase
MHILGICPGNCRRPLGKMTRKGFDRIIETARQVHAERPEIFNPIEAFYNVDIAFRLNDPGLEKEYQAALCYEDY